MTNLNLFGHEISVDNFAGGTHAAAVAAFLAPYYGTGSGETGRDLRAPAPTATTKQRFMGAPARAVA